MIKSALFACLLWLMAGSVWAVQLTHEQERLNKGYYRTFQRLVNTDSVQFYNVVEQYLDYLKSTEQWEAYYKIKTNEGFFSVRNQHTYRAIKVEKELKSTILENGDSAFLYLAAGLEGDILKMMRDPKADSVYQEALGLVGDRDPKFKTLTHISLAQVNYMTAPKTALEWADCAIDEAYQLDKIEYMSLSLGIKCYVYFMLGEQENFEKTRKQLIEVKRRFDEEISEKEKQRGRQFYSDRYETIVKVGTEAFAGNFDEAFDIARSGPVNVDRQMVLFRLYVMRGEYEDSVFTQKMTWLFIGLTVFYIFIYIMGRRRLMLKIWERERKLKEALARAEEGNRTKTQFIRSMSHEIRTPLNAINGFSQILCSDDFELSKEERDDMKQRISKNSDAITIIINELLEMAAGERVSVDLNTLPPVNISEVCTRAMNEAGVNNEHGLLLTFENLLPTGFITKSSEETIVQILIKIIDNGLKFTKEGTVTVMAATKNNMVEISVSDTGIGIPKEQRDVIFDNFVKLDDFSEGIGLGLSICRRLAKTLGGDVILDPEYEKGSRFILQLPIVQ